MIAESNWNWFLILVNCEYKAAWSAHVDILHQKKNSFKTGEWRTKIKRKSYLCVQYLLVYQLGTCITLNDKQLLRIRFNYISVSYRDRYNPYIHRFRFSIEKKIASCKSLFIEPQQKHLVKCIWIITFYGWFTQNLILFSAFLASFLSHRYSSLLCSNRKSQNSLKRNQASKKSSAIRKKRNTRNILFPWRCENVSNRIIKTI